MMDPYIKKLLACPACHGPLADGEAPRCPSCGLTFPKPQGIPCLFALEKDDRWAKNQSGSARFLAENPSAARALEEADEDALNGADLMAKSALRQTQGRFREAAELSQAAWRRCYSEEYVRRFEAQLAFIAGCLADHAGPIVDIASGRGMLVSRLLERTKAPLIATDLSPSVLSGYQASRWPEQLASGRLSLLAFDAAAMPFADGSLPVVTTCLGLQNIPDPESVLRELRRVCGGALYALCGFFPEADHINHAAAARLGLAGAYSRAALTAMLEKAGWQVDSHEEAPAPLPPTPVGQLIPGLQVDGLPVVETTEHLVTLICR